MKTVSCVLSKKDKDLGNVFSVSFKLGLDKLIKVRIFMVLYLLKMLNQ
jgi:hypothetical protein